MRVIVTTTAGSVVRSGPRQEREAAVLEDLRSSVTLAPARDNRRRANRVSIFGTAYRYKAILEGFELPEGWCVCRPGSGECRCHESEDSARDVAIYLIAADPISSADYRDIAGGDSYKVDFSTDPLPLEEWWSQAKSMWLQVQMRIAQRPGSQVDDPLGRWHRVVALRRGVVEALAQPIPYEVVELDDAGLVAFELPDPGGQGREQIPAVIPPDVIYEPAGHRGAPARLRTLEVDDGRLLCEVEQGDPVEIVEFADRQRGTRRRLVRNQEATSAMLRREEFVMRDVLAGRAVNPRLLEILRDPTEAVLDDWLDLTGEPEQSLDEAQERAVLRAMQARHLLLVQGPPGTGKTTFIAELVVRHLRTVPGDTVLVASQTHQATDNLLRRLHQLDPDLALVRVGRDERKIAEDVRHLWIEADEPWIAGTRLRAERYRRFARAQAAAGDWNADSVEELLAVQDRYFDTQGLQRSRGERVTAARVVAGTCYAVSSDPDVRDRSYGLAILEEAGKASPTEALMAMLSARKAVLVGDSRQLPPTPDRGLEEVLRAAANGGRVEPELLAHEAVALARVLKLERERLLDRGEPAPPPFAAETLFAYLARRLTRERPELQAELKTQYRMVGGIGELISKCFYDGELLHGRQSQPGEGRDPRVRGAQVRVVDVAGREEFAHGSRSARNPAEVRAVLAELRRIEAAAAGGEPLGVAVITGYAAQLRALDQALEGAPTPGLTIRTGLVDRFQGDEDEVVVFSAARTEGAGFLRVPNRINVSLSRARSQLVICGHVERARAGKLGDPLRAVISFVDGRVAAGDSRFEVVRGRTR